MEILLLSFLRIALGELGFKRLDAIELNEISPNYLVKFAEPKQTNLILGRNDLAKKLELSIFPFTTKTKKNGLKSTHF